jgi:hypothetical protein
MAKDIKLYKGSSEITINESNLEHFLTLGYKQEQQTKQNKSNKDKKTWQHITEKKEL